MAKEKQAAPGEYSQVVAKLETIVEVLEGGELSLEDSIERFAEGMRLVKAGEKLLAEHEKRIEQLVSDDGAVAPLAEAQAEASPAARPAKSKRAATPTDDDDVPF